MPRQGGKKKKAKQTKQNLVTNTDEPITQELPHDALCLMGSAKPKSHGVVSLEKWEQEGSWWH